MAQKHLKTLGQGLPKKGGDKKFTPVYVEDPNYPRRALEKNKGGHAIVSVTITKDGDVKDIELIEEYPERWGFGKAALKAAKKLKYVPQVKDGQAIEVPNVFYRYTFSIR